MGAKTGMLKSFVKIFKKTELDQQEDGQLATFDIG